MYLVVNDIGDKLLPKFLNDDYKPDYEYANVIIDVITQSKSEGWNAYYTKLTLISMEMKLAGNVLMMF